MPVTCKKSRQFRLGQQAYDFVKLGNEKKGKRRSLALNTDWVLHKTEMKVSKGKNPTSL